MSPGNDLSGLPCAGSANTPDASQGPGLAIAELIAICCTDDMGLFLGTFAWLAGTVQFALSFQQVRKANPREKIPQFFGRPKSHPPEIYVYRAIALFLLMLSFVAWSEALGTWAVLLIVVAAIPTVVLNVRHNRHVQRSFQ